MSVRQFVMLGLPRRPARRIASQWRAGPLRHLEWILDESELSRSANAMRVRLLLGSLFAVCGLVFEAIALSAGRFEVGPLWFLFGSLPIFLNRLGRFGRYFLPVILGFYAYSNAATWSLRFKLDVHYLPQIRVDELIGAGAVPTVWLQEHIYRGTTGPLEVFCVIAYGGHFFIPLGLSILLAAMNRAREFKLLMFGLLSVILMGVITFIVAPTAPPWLAAQDGYLSGVHHILKQSLSDMHLTAIAAAEGDASKYDITAAAPSLHAAFPLICLLVAWRARLPRPVLAFLALDLVSVLFAIVYMGEHYVFDGIVGLAYGFVAVSLVRAAAATGEPRAAAHEPAVSSRSASPRQVEPYVE